MKTDIGIIGMGVMGQNLALNMASKGYGVSVYNRRENRTREFAENKAKKKDIIPTYDLAEFVKSLDKPKKILLMIKAGSPVDEVIAKLTPLLDEGDVILDGGNSNFRDTDRRVEEANSRGLLYLGTGISGGEYGARHGPSIMPGGNEEAYDLVGNLLEDIAAQIPEGPCCAYLGPRSAGHYVKMVHNGIEYGVMESIAEAYWLMNKGLNMEPEDMSSTFEKWNEDLDSYLMEITVSVLKEEDEKTGKPLINLILDTAEQKGTGKWTVQNALELGVPVPTISAAVDGRFISSRKRERKNNSDKIFLEKPARLTGKSNWTEKIHDALYLSTVSAYTQGIYLLNVASSEYEYDLNLDEVARIWKDGCIIRSNLLDEAQKGLRNDPENPNLLFVEPFLSNVKDKSVSTREILSRGRKAGLALPAISSSLDYLVEFSSAYLPANMIQAQRDFFGAHTYQRRDREGYFHNEWLDDN
ncbi:NADP-dependent phosphogluconate dehydrogenase [Candidatus Bipolaricaulota bacterium]|nr:NADP-dependent phosphogluconate dehydrogenase [Candidatus Bipolaricaulota bacterium]MBS3814433.1 NADP-dependent phosphogluconate dehydrogenase [Candidatus Bipolaricaulota bacterium]MBS3825387.1 NADP-dependent phosphogluconate dehydrogenase [Candidatus Bipolaricaulota bacterium]